MSQCESSIKLVKQSKESTTSKKKKLTNKTSKMRDRIKLLYAPKHISNCIKLY